MSEEKYFTMIWRIKNFSFCWHQNDEELSSPIFYIEGLQRTEWTLFLIPRISKSREDSVISCYLRRNNEENSGQGVEIDYELSVLGKDGRALESIISRKCIVAGNDWTAPLFLDQKKVFLNEQDAFLPDDSLTIRCRIWQNGQNITKSEQYFATTQIEVEMASLFGVVKTIDNCLFKDKRYSVKFLSSSTKTVPILMNIIVTEEGPYAEIKLVKSEAIRFCKCKLHFTDVYQEERLYGQDDFLFHFDLMPLCVDEPVWRFPLIYTSEPFIYLEKLSLRCEIEYSLGLTSEKIEKVDNSTTMLTEGFPISEKHEEPVLSLIDDVLS